MNLNIGLFYQSGNNLEACYFALNQFRKFYPDSPIALYEDNSDFLLPVAKKFNCTYSKTKVKGILGRPAFNIETTLAWLDRVFEACTTTLKDCEFIIHFEDDVWFKRKLQQPPLYDLSGIKGYGWSKELFNYLNIKPNRTYGCGGAIFKRLKFLEAYENAKNIDWNTIYKLDPGPCEWTDSALTFIFAWSKLSYGTWSEASQYRNPDALTLVDRRGWNEPIDVLEKKQGEAAIIHCWKPYYFPTEEEKDYVNKNLQNFK
jgi:hypothetical protein